MGIDSCSAIQVRCFSSASIGMRRKSKRWQRLRIVGSTRCGSVVASTNTTRGGGSSSVLSRALKAAVESMWHSSTTYTFQRACTGANRERSIRSRMLSTPVLEAASISITSRAVPAAIVVQSSQVPQGSGVGPSLLRQLSERARILALEVLPVPRGPLKR